MSDTPPIDPVQAQYERWIYPPPAYDLTLMPLSSPEWHHLDRTLYWLFWPAGRFARTWTFWLQDAEVWLPPPRPIFFRGRGWSASISAARRWRMKKP